MPSFIDFLPLLTEDIDSVRARLDADVNAGVDPSSDDFVDTTEGGFYFDLTQGVALEIARLWDVVSSEVPAACFPAFAWGDYLDEHGETLGLTRKPATAATGVVTFTGTNGTLIVAGTEIATATLDDDDTAIVFTTDITATIASGTASVAVTAEEEGSAGSVLSNTVTVLLTPNSGIASLTNAAAITGGSDVETDEDYRDRILLELSSAQGAGTISDYQRWALAYPGIGSATVTPIWAGAGTVHVVVTDVQNDPVSSTVQYGLQDYLDPPGFLTSTSGSHTLPVGTVNVLTTTGATATGTFRLGNQTVTYTGKTSNTFTGCTGGTGTFPGGTRVAQDFGKGRGLAPIGAVVTVDTVTVLNVAVVATVTFETGYSLDGAASTIATRADITSEVTTYINSLPPGQNVIHNHVLSRFFRVRGVHDVTVLTLNGSGGDIAVTSLQVPTVSATTLT